MKLKPPVWRTWLGITLVASVYVAGALLAGPMFGKHGVLSQRLAALSAPSSTPQPVIAPPPTPTPVAPPSSPQAQAANPQPAAGKYAPKVGTNPFAGERLFIDPDSPAAQTRAAWAGTRPADAALMSKIANTPVATWLGDWYANVGQATRQWIGDMRGQGALPVFVLYNIPIRDCGSYSAGGASSADAYRNWISAISQSANGSKAVFILEPDALAGWDCLTEAQRNERASLLRYAIDTLSGPANHYVYLDAGNARWQSPETIAQRIRQIGAPRLQGVALNVSNFLTTSESRSYGQRLSSLTGGLHVVIDTSRNGQGPMPDLSWCNPIGRGLGSPPSAQAGNPVDALLWVKYPGESDGACNGGPTSGQWWPDYALGLAQRAAF